MAQRDVEISKTITRKKTVYTCDKCGEENYLGLEKCFICGGEFCRKCYVYMPDKSMWWHDYEHCCCKYCWNGGKSRREFLDAKEERFRESVKSNISLWKIEMGARTDSTNFVV